MIEISERTKRFTIGPAGGASRPQVGILFFLVASLTVVSGIGLSASLRFPEVLLDNRSFAASLVASQAVTVVASLLGLFAGGVLTGILARALVPQLAEGRRRLAFLLGRAAGFCWGTSAVLGLILVPLWANDLATGVSVLARAAFLSVALVAPLLFAAWTVLLVRQFRDARISGVLGAVGLLLVSGRSSVWVLNTLLPVEEGFYFVSAMLTLLALLGYPIWICWLVRMGFLFRKPSESNVVPGVGKRLGVGLLAAIFVMVHAGVGLVSTPMPNSDDVPSVPSAGGAGFYTLMLVLRDTFALPASHPLLLSYRQDEHYTRPEVPRGASLRKVDAGGVPADYICADGAYRNRAVLYLHGGGFVLPTSNGHRQFAATISRRTGACVLLPHYRLAPEHPFPAAMQDSVTAYRWLRRQGVAASRIAIFGDSAGATFTLATALWLRDSGDALPAALVSLSPGTDLTLSGETHRTKVGSDPVLSRDDVRFSVRSYTGNGAANPRDPLLSPLFADPEGLPPTLLMVGSQEVLLSDSIRMADRLRAAGVPVKLEVWPGMPHDLPLIAGETMEGRLATQHIVTYISHHMSQGTR